MQVEVKRLTRDLAEITNRSAPTQGKCGSGTIPSKVWTVKLKFELFRHFRVQNWSHWIRVEILCKTAVVLRPELHRRPDSWQKQDVGCLLKKSVPKQHQVEEWRGQKTTQC